MKTPTEFGAKISISLIDGYAFLDELDWRNYNEGTDLKQSIERYHDRRGVTVLQALLFKISGWLMPVAA